jgi:hypothetical protein
MFPVADAFPDDGTGWIPMIGWLLAIGGTFYVYYRTQQGLNTVWDAGGRGYTPPAPR